MRTEVPPGLRTCPDPPTPPAGEDVTQRDVARHLVEIHQAYEDCRATHRAVVEMVDPAEPPAQAPVE